MDTNYQQNAKIFKAFCDASRLKILDMLKDGEKCGCMLLEEMHITQPTLSHHMKYLCESGIINCRKEGKWMHYSINKENLNHAQEILASFGSLTENKKYIIYNR